MSGAYNHKVRPLTEDEIKAQENEGRRTHAWYKKYVEEYDADPEACSWRAKDIPQLRLVTMEDRIASERKCRISHHCDTPSTHMLSYLYVTGRRGNVSMMEKPVCAAHAAKYQKGVSQ